MSNPTNQATPQAQPDALTPLMGGEGQNPNPNSIPDTINPALIDPALEKRVAETEQANQALQQQVAALLAKQEAEAAKVPLTPEQVGKPYTGEVELLIHPHLGTEVPVKKALVDSAIEQGFKRPTAKKK